MPALDLFLADLLRGTRCSLSYGLFQQSLQAHTSKRQHRLPHLAPTDLARGVGTYQVIFGKAANGEAGAAGFEPAFPAQPAGVLSPELHSHQSRSSSYLDNSLGRDSCSQVFGGLPLCHWLLARYTAYAASKLPVKPSSASLSVSPIMKPLTSKARAMTTTTTARMLRMPRGAS